MATPAWEELSDSPREDYSDRGFRAVRKIITPWSTRGDIALELMGTASQGLGLSAGLAYPGSESVRCTRVGIEPLADDVLSQSLSALDSDIQAYASYALLTVRYESVNADTGLIDEDLPTAEDGTYLSYRQGISAEALTVPGTAMQWVSGNQPIMEVDTTFTKLIPLQEHYLTWHRVVDPPKDTFRDIIGKLNNAVYLGAAAHTLLFAGATLDREYTFLGEFDRDKVAYKITLTFKERRIQGANNAVHGWDKEWKTLPQAEAGWSEIQNGDGTAVYEEADFTRLTQLVDPGEVL